MARKIQSVAPQGAIPAARQKKIRDYLKARGHSVSRVDGKQIRDDDELRAALLDLHGVTLVEYQRARGGVA
jgi:hypothetical protein